MSWFAILGLLGLIYLYGGYVLVLRIINGFAASKHLNADARSCIPQVTVLITVFNEAGAIEARIQDVLECDYPVDLMEILVASDGSTDETDALVAGIGDPRVRLFRPACRRGKTDTQNQAIAQAKGDVVIFTDADTRFDSQFIKEVVAPFADPKVGGVDGHLLFLTDAERGISQSQGFYWRQELQIRSLESRLGMLAVASGACMAVRRSIFRPMLGTVGEDCLIPLDVVDQGYRMVHADRAIAFDRMEHEPQKEFRARVRMTLRNWQGTWLYPQLLNPLHNLPIAWGLWSHKVLRWLSPLFLLAWLLGSLVIVVVSNGWLGVPGVMFMAMALAGAFNLRFPGATVVYSFCLANVGFLVGVAKAVVGQKIMAYR